MPEMFKHFENERRRKRKRENENREGDMNATHNTPKVGMPV
jgi:hypothetical protein